MKFQKSMKLKPPFCRVPGLLTGPEPAHQLGQLPAQEIKIKVICQRRSSQQEGMF